MYQQPTKCPYHECLSHRNSMPWGFRKRGYYSPKQTGRPVARYECKTCERTFSNRAFAPDYQQKRPDINKPLAELLCSGVTLRRAAKILNVAYNTVCRRLPWLAQQARVKHRARLQSGEVQTSYIQFDEMESFEHAAAKSLCIALAVRAKTGEILSAKVGQIPAKGRLAARGQRLYGWTKNESALVCQSALMEASLAAKPGVTVGCDGATSYPALILSAMPGAFLQAGPRKPSAGFDPLFRLNHTCAKIRADLARMARKTWTTTKRMVRLQDQLDIYVAWTNKY